MVKLVIVLGVFLFLFSCKKEQNKVVNNSYDSYQPFEEGKFFIYKILTVQHDVALLPAHDSSVYYAKYVVSESIIDLENEAAKKMKVYKKDSLHHPWVLSDVWQGKKTKTTFELVEENERITRLVFPIRSSQSWDLNAHNTKNEALLFYANLHEPKTINGHMFDSTLVVKDEPYFTFVDYRYSYETYANHVGLVQGRYKNLRINNFDTLQVEKGDELHLVLIDYN